MRANRLDSNQPQIVAALRARGCFVQVLNAVKDGCPDLLVIHAGERHLLEVKDGAKVPSKRRLTPDEQAWHDDAARAGYRVPVVQSAGEALRAVGLNP